jgi:hypothetical protein
MNIDRAKAAYGAVTYPGDLAAELLPTRRGLGWRGAMMWAIPAAVAAMVAVAVWPHRPGAQKTEPTIAKVAPERKVELVVATRPSLHELRGLQYSLYVTQVRSGVEDAMAQLGNGVDAALDAPVVTDSVATVKQVAGEIQELASVTWSQIKPRGPGC